MILAGGTLQVKVPFQKSFRRHRFLPHPWRVSGTAGEASGFDGEEGVGPTVV
jgi:hypothetical protein